MYYEKIRCLQQVSTKIYNDYVKLLVVGFERWQSFNKTFNIQGVPATVVVNVTLVRETDRSKANIFATINAEGRSFFCVINYKERLNEKPLKTPRKPDGTITTQINNQTLIIEVFFNHDSKETFQDKLLSAILVDLPTGLKNE